VKPDYSIYFPRHRLKRNTDKRFRELLGRCTCTDKRFRKLCQEEGIIDPYIIMLKYVVLLPADKILILFFDKK
jgi:hypothetical protein